MSAHRTPFRYSFLHALIGAALLFASGLPARPGMAKSTAALHLLTPPHKPAHAPNAATPRDVVFVVDTSSAMSGSLSDIRIATKAKIDEMATQVGAWRWTVITFRDNVSLLGTTTDAATAKNWLDVIGADGGGDCPSESFGALQLAADVAPGGDVWLFTASSPHGGEIALHQTITKLRARNMRVYPLVLGWCNGYGYPLSAQQVQGTLALSTQSTQALASASGNTHANGLYTLSPNVGAVALAGGQFAAQAAPQTDEQTAGTTRTVSRVNGTTRINESNAINATDFTISLTPYGQGWFYPGTAQRYTLYATGNITASNVVITLTLPNSVTYQSYNVFNTGQPGGGLTPILAGNQVIWSIGAVQGAWEQQFNVQVAVSPNAPTGTANAAAEIGPSVVDENLYNNSSVLPRGGYIHEIAAMAVNPAVEKYLLSPLPYYQQIVPTPGKEITYGLNVYNKGNTFYNNPVVVTDVLPANLEFITATVVNLYGGNTVPSSFTQNGQTLTWNLANLPVAYSYSAYPPGPLYYSPVWAAYVRVRVLPSAPISSSLVNVLQVSTPATDTNPADNVFTHTVNVAAATHDTFVTKSISNCYPYYPNTYCGYAPNADFEYAINFANSGNSAASNVRITDTLPAELTFITTTWTQGFSVVDNELRWNLGELNAFNANAGYMMVRVRVKNTATPGTLFTNTIQICQNEADVSPDNNQASATASVIAPVFDVSVQKFLSGYCYNYPGNICEFPQGTLVDYYLSYANNSNTLAPNVKLTDTLPFDGAEFVSTSVPTGMVQSGNQLIWSLGDLTSGYSSYYNNIRVTLRVPINATPGSLFTNTAEINLSETDAYTANNRSLVQTRAVVPTRDMAVSKTLCGLVFSGGYLCYPPNPGDVWRYVPGDTVQYAISYRNSGNSPATVVRITDTLPFAGATFVTSTLNTSLTLAGSQLIWDIGTVLPSSNNYYYPGETFYVLLKVPNNTLPGTRFTNTVQVSLNETDILTDNNASLSVGQVVTPFVNLAVQKTSDVPKTLPGRKINYAVNVLHSYDYFGSAQSNTHARNLRVTDTLPSGVALLGLSYPQSATVSNNQIVWSLGTLMRGETKALTVSVQTGNLPISTVLTNTVRVGDDLPDVDLADNQFGMGVLVYTPTVALAVYKTANANYLLPGQLLTYTLRAYQQGNYTSEGDATNVVVTDVLPSGLTVLGTSLDAVSPLSVTRNGNLLTWNVGTLARPDLYYGCYDVCPGPELQIYARVNEAPLGMRITNTAYITSNEIPLNTSWLSSTHQLVVGEADIYNNINPWHVIATETGGHALRVGFSYGIWGPLLDSIDTLLEIIWGEMQQSATLHRSPTPTDLALYSCNYFTSVCVTTMTVSVDSTLQDLHVLLVRNVSNYYTQKMDLVAPDNTVYVPSSGMTTTTTYVDRVRVPNPQSGNWKMVVSGYVASSDAYELTVTARASSRAFKLLSRPAIAANLPSRLSIQSLAATNASFAVLSPSLSEIVNVNLFDDGTHDDGTANDGVFAGTWLPPQEGSYRLAMSGTAALQNAPEVGPYQRVDSKPFHVQNLIVTGPGSWVAQPGSSGTAVFTLTNHANTTRTVNLAYSQSQGWASLTGAPNQLKLGPGQSQAVSIAYSVPVTATDFSTASLSLLAQNVYVGEFGDYETAQITARVYADVAVSGVLPASVKPGQNVTLTLAYSNTGGAAANGLKLMAVLPPGLGYVRDTSGVTPTMTGNQLVWSLPALPANGSGGFVLIASVAANATGNLNIALSISTSSDEINLPNNTAAPVTQVTPPDSTKRKQFLPLVRR